MENVELFLREYGCVILRISELEREKNEVKTKKQSEYDEMLKVKRFNSDRIKGGKISDSTLQAVIRLIDVYGQREAEIAENLHAAYGRKAYTEDVIAKVSLTQEEYRFICMRYNQGMSMLKISMKIRPDGGCSVATVKRIKKRCLDKIKSSEPF